MAPPSFSPAQLPIVGLNRDFPVRAARSSASPLLCFTLFSCFEPKRPAKPTPLSSRLSPFEFPPSAHLLVNFTYTCRRQTLFLHQTTFTIRRLERLLPAKCIHQSLTPPVPASSPTRCLSRATSKSTTTTSPSCAQIRSVVAARPERVRPTTR